MVPFSLISSARFLFFISGMNSPYSLPIRPQNSFISSIDNLSNSFSSISSSGTGSASSSFSSSFAAAPIGIQNRNANNKSGTAILFIFIHTALPLSDFASSILNRISCGRDEVENHFNNSAYNRYCQQENEYFSGELDFRGNGTKTGILCYVGAQFRNIGNTYDFQN